MNDRKTNVLDNSVAILGWSRDIDAGIPAGIPRWDLGGLGDKYVQV